MSTNKRTITKSMMEKSEEINGMQLSEMIPEIIFNESLLWEISYLMGKYGGSFVQSLAECIKHADPMNQYQLIRALSRYYRDYLPSNWRNSYTIKDDEETGTTTN